MGSAHFGPSPAERRRKRERRNSIIGLAVSVVVILGIASMLTWRMLAAEEIDETTLCSANRAPVMQVAFLLDITDPLGEIQREFVSRQLAAIQADVPVGGQLALYALRDSARASLDPEIRLCNPGSGEDASWMWQNPGMLKAQWDESFRGPLDRVIQEAIKSGASRQSPLMEQVQAVSVTAFHEDARERTLVLVSDMLQNTDAFSMYEAQLTFSEFRSSAAYDALSCRLPGVQVEIYYIQRPGSPYRRNKRDHITFWEGYFESCGALVRSVELVPGLGG